MPARCGPREVARGVVVGHGRPLGWQSGCGASRSASRAVACRRRIRRWRRRPRRSRAPARPSRLSERRTRGLDRRLDVGGRDAVVGHGPDLTMRIRHHHDAACLEGGQKRGSIALDPEQDEVRSGPSSGRAGRGSFRLSAGRSRRPRRRRPCRRAPRRGDGRWRGPRRAARSCRRGRRRVRRARPRRGSRPVASRHRPSSERAAPAR